MKKITLFLLLVLSLAVQARRHTDITVLQWNVWQEGTGVKGGYEAIVDEIVRLKPDFVMLSEVRNYNNRPFSRRLERSLAEKGLTYPSANPDVAVDRLTWAPLSDERERIDFVYYKGKARPLEARVFGPGSSIAYGKILPDPGLDAYILPRGVWPTDHKGVWVKFRLY